MKADKIYISEFEFLTIEELKIERMVGEHATATISGCICDDNIHIYRQKVLERVWVEIIAEEENSEKKTLMMGFVAGLSFRQEQHATCLTLVLKSATYQMDIACHFRSFQNHMTYLDVFNVITQSYKKYGVMGESCLETSSINFLLQYKETDWMFLKRLASHFGLSITPAITREGVFYYVGNRNYSEHEVLPFTDYSATKCVDKYMEQGANDIESFIEQDYLEYQVSLKEIYDLWDKLIFGSENGYVYRIHSEYSRGELIHTYYLRSIKRMGNTCIFNEKYAGYSFLAKVIEIREDKVKIILDGDENENQNNSQWFPYSTGYSSPDGSGWYCMPEIGDRVRLQLPDSKEEHAYVISAVHMPADKGRKNPDFKSFKTKYGKELLFMPDSIKLTNNKGMSIKISDRNGISIKSNKNISITAKENLTISSEDSALTIVGSESVDITQAKAGLYLEQDVTFTGGKFRIQ